MAAGTIKYRPSLDGLRAIAVLAVLGFHAFPRAVTGGFIGVDIFFVISGYLISTILYARLDNPATNPGRVIAAFYARRIRRIFPSLLVVLAACYVLGLYTLIPSEFKSLGQQVAASAGFCLNLVLSGSTGYFNSDSGNRPLLHIWSLGVEEQFYLVWPLVIWLGSRRKGALLPIVVFLAACSFFWCEGKPPESAAAAFFLPQMRFWEILIGAITAIVLLPGEGAVSAGAGLARLPDVLATLGALAIAGGLFFDSAALDIPDAWTLLPTVGAALIIAAGESSWLSRRVLSNRALVWLGLISYPLYLWHWPLLSLAQTVLGVGDSMAIKLALLAAAVLLAWATTILVENPIRFGPGGGWKTAALLAAMAVAGGAGYLAFRHDGFPSRFPRFIQELASYSYDPKDDWREGTYFLVSSEDETDFKRDASEIRKDRPTLYLWGDSHAAALYPGFRARYGSRYNVVQRTAGALPPLLGDTNFTKIDGRYINHYIFESIKRDRPETVVLAADWCSCRWQDVAVTIKALKAVGIRHIVLVGPAPQWIGSLPEQIYSYCRRHHFSAIPKRMKTGLNPEVAQIDQLMPAFCARLGAEYISPYRLLHNQDGVLIRLGDSPETLIAFDYGHLTKAGSIYLVSRFPAD